MKTHEMDWERIHKAWRWAAKVVEEERLWKAERDLRRFRRRRHKGDGGRVRNEPSPRLGGEIGRASCRERV